jgi:hypothetical protein
MAAIRGRSAKADFIEDVHAYIYLRVHTDVGLDTGSAALLSTIPMVYVSANGRGMLRGSGGIILGGCPLPSYVRTFSYDIGGKIKDMPKAVRSSTRPAATIDGSDELMCSTCLTVL